MGNGASGADLDRNRIVADLARCELLADASPEDLRQLADLLTPVSAAAGVVLMSPADAADGFLFVTRGRVGVAADREPSGRKEFVVPEGSIVGELALLGRAHRAVVTALTEVHCLMGARPAAMRLLGIRGARDRVIRLARHHLAATSCRCRSVCGTARPCRSDRSCPKTEVPSCASVAAPRT